MKSNVICLGTIWDLDEAIYPVVEDYMAMKSRNLRLVEDYQLSSSSKEIRHIVKKPLFPRNQYGVRVKTCCASCAFKVISSNGFRFCTYRERKVVDAKEKCRHWQMSEELMRLKIKIEEIWRK